MSPYVEKEDWHYLAVKKITDRNTTIISITKKNNSKT